MSLVALIGLVCCTAADPGSPYQSRSDRRLVPVADAYVDSSLKKQSFATTNSLIVGAKPTRTSFLRFDVRGVAGRAVEEARLRLYQQGRSPHGGKVFSIPATSWSENLSWKTGPSSEGHYLGAFGPVQPNRWYEIDVSPAIGEDGPVAFAITSSNARASAWASRHSPHPPQLIIDLDPLPGSDGATVVASSQVGSSDPTYFPNNHRMAVTSGGRFLVVHGRHLEGVQLAWRDPSGGWENGTTGSVTDGLLLRNAATGDWPASIAVASDHRGEEHAWVVWSRASLSDPQPRPVELRRLSDLDHPNGPSVGPVVTVDRPSLGAVAADIAFERAKDGGSRGVVSWVRHTGYLSFEVMSAWLTDLSSETPRFQRARTVFSATSAPRPTLEPASDGLRLVTRGAGGELTIYRRSASDPAGEWHAVAGGVSVARGSAPSAVVLDSGETLAAVERKSDDHVVTVQRFSEDGGEASIELQVEGYSHPTMATNGTGAWLVMVRRSDGHVVSRRYSPASGWSSVDVVEIRSEGRRDLTYPNALRRMENVLRFVVSSPQAASPGQSAVLAYERSLRE
jgi:hypothetical protein